MMTIPAPTPTPAPIAVVLIWPSSELLVASSVVFGDAVGANVGDDDEDEEEEDDVDDVDDAASLKEVDAGP